LSLCKHSDYLDAWLKLGVYGLYAINPNLLSNTYALSYRDLEEMMSERGLSVVHTTIYRWVQRFAPELEKRMRPHLKKSNDSWRVDETYVKVRGKWMYLYRAVDSSGQTLDFLLNQTRSKRAAKRFFRKVLGQSHVTKPRVITVDKNASYPPAIDDLKQDKLLSEECQYRASKYLNNMIEQDHRFIKRRVYGFITSWVKTVSEDRGIRNWYAK
jgi:transposase, IS6 family